MRYQGFRLVAALAVLGVLGSGAAAYLATTAGEEEVIPQGEVSAPRGGPAMPTTACIFSKDDPCNPDAKLSDAERDALYQRLRIEGDRLHREWLATIDIDALDLGSLPRVEMPALSLPGESSLSDAAARAHVIVAGKVSEVRPTQGVAIDTVFTVEHAMKGTVGSTIAISQAGRLQPTQDGSSVEIVQAANAPLLIPGDRAVLFLQETESAGGASGGYYIQSSSGWYQVVDGKIRASPVNTFAASVNAKTEAEFLDLLTVSLR